MIGVPCSWAPEVEGDGCGDSIATSDSVAVARMSVPGGDAEQGSRATADTAVFSADPEVGRDLRRSTGRPPRSARRRSGRRACRRRWSILLSSRFSMWMAWGPELTFFCNAAYRRDTLGGKYPGRSAGRPARCGRRSGTTSARGSTAFCRPGRRPGTRRCCCSWNGPATRRRRTTRSPTARCATTTGKVVGMLCVVSEDTERVIGERRMATLRDLGSDPSVVPTERRCSPSRGGQLGRNRGTCRSP